VAALERDKKRTLEKNKSTQMRKLLSRVFGMPKPPSDIIEE